MKIIKIIQFVKEYIKYMTIEQVMNNENFDKELDVIVINNNRPITFTKEDYEVIEGIPRYTD